MRENIHESFWYFTGALIVIGVICFLMTLYYGRMHKTAKFQERIAYASTRRAYFARSQEYATHGVYVMAIYGIYALLYR